MGSNRERYGHFNTGEGGALTPPSPNAHLSTDRRRKKA